MDPLYTAIYNLQAQGGAGAVCTIIESSGSTPRHAGSKMLVYEDGHFIGTVGGGQVEMRVIDEALRRYPSWQTAPPAIFDGRSAAG